MLVLVDLDGTISDSRWRDDLAETKQWDEYHSQLGNDPPIKPMIALINCLVKGGANVIGLTGRPERWHQLTIDWLLAHDVKLEEVWYRPDENYMKVSELKPEIAKEIMAMYPGEDNVVIIDDNEYVCKAMRENGIVALTVGLC